VRGITFKLFFDSSPLTPYPLLFIMILQFKLN
jgi:hypothetical protein